MLVSVQSVAEVNLSLPRVMLLFELQRGRSELMASQSKSQEPVVSQLNAILVVLQDLLILQAAAAGIGKAQTREIAGVADARVTRIWKHIKKERGSR